MRVASPGTVIENQQSDAATRKGDLDPTLLSILQSLAKELNVGITVQSGGQAVKSNKEHQAKFTAAEIAKYKDLGRVGSGRHDAGKAADFLLFAPDIGTLNNDVVNDDNPNDEELKLLQSFVALGKKKGLKGFGSGDGYMDNYATFHADIVGTRDGGSSLWGKGSKSANTPVWLKEAFNNPDKFAPSVSDVGDDSNTAEVGSLRREGDADPIGFIAAAETGGDPSEFIEGAPIPTKRPKSRRKFKRKPDDDGDNTYNSLFAFGVDQLLQMAPETALSQVSNQLGSKLEFLAPDVLSSIQSGEGIDPLVNLVDTLTSQDTVAGRVATLGEFAESNKEMASLFSANLTDKLPALPLIIDLLNASPRDRAQIILENKDALQEMLGIDLSSIPETFEYDGAVINLLDALQGKDTTIGTIRFVKDAVGAVDKMFGKDVEVIPETASAILEFLDSDDPQVQKQALEKLNSLGVKLPDEVNYLTATPEELLNNPVVKSELGQAQMFIDPSKGKQDIENMISTYISEQSSISVSGAKTLAFGGGAEAAKKLQSEVGSIAFEGLVESFPILGQIIEFFNQNQGLLTILGTAGAAAGLSAFTGGGFLGSMVAGAGVMATARLALGEEGYSKFEGILGQGAEQAVGIFREAFLASGLADNEYIAPIVEGLFNFTENNPVASALGATGNLGGALGAYLAQNAIDTMDNPEGMERLIEGLRSRSNMSSQNGVSQTIRNSNGGDQNVPYRPSDQNNPENDTGPKSQEIARVSGDMYRSQAWAHVDTDSGYGWPHSTIN